jgi:hypothetical protein
MKDNGEARRAMRSIALCHRLLRKKQCPSRLRAGRSACATGGGQILAGGGAGFADAVVVFADLRVKADGLRL